MYSLRFIYLADLLQKWPQTEQQQGQRQQRLLALDSQHTPARSEDRLLSRRVVRQSKWVLYEKIPAVQKIVGHYFQIRAGDLISAPRAVPTDLP